MGQISIILVAGLIFLFSIDFGVYEVGFDVGWTLAVTIGMTFVPALLAYLFGLLATHTVPPEKRLSRIFLFKHLVFGFELLVLVAYVVDIYYFHLLALIRHWFGAWPFPYTRQLFGILPLLIGMLGTYLAYYEIERRVHGSFLSRRGYLQLRLKFLLLPVLPLVIYLSILDVIQLLPLQVRIFFIRHPYLGMFILLLLLLVAYARSADILQLIWPARPLPPCPMRTQLDMLAERTGIRFRDILIWQTRSAQIANAAVTGLFPRSRYILITDRLLECLNVNEIEAVVAHEMGHLKHKHILIYLIYSVLYFFCYAAFQHYVRPIYASWTSLPLWDAVFTILFFACYFVLLFRYLSRQFEHQADLYAVQVTKDPEAFISALSKLSQVNRTPRLIRRWLEIFHTHPSIEQRCRFIEQTIDGVPRNLKYLRTLPITRWIMVLAPLILVLLFPSVHTLFAAPVEIHREIGRQYSIERQYANAVRELEEALELDPDNMGIIYDLAALYYEQEEWQKAEDALSRILTKEPQYRPAMELLQRLNIRYHRESEQEGKNP